MKNKIEEINAEKLYKDIDNLAGGQEMYLIGIIIEKLNEVIKRLASE